MTELSPLDEGACRLCGAPGPLFRNPLQQVRPERPVATCRPCIERELAEVAARNGSSVRKTRTAVGVLLTPPPGPAENSPRTSRRVDLTPYLNGTYVAPEPSAGAIRDDGAYLLYPGRWHTCVGLTGSGKSWLALAHVRDEMLNAGRTVVYVHFEESSPAGTLGRLRSLGLAPELLVERFVWLDNDRMWERGEMGAELASLAPGLVILDGQNAASVRHGKGPSDPETVGWFRDRFVTPAVASGAAVLSLGHPPKAKDRQDERHGYGASGWLDEVDGVGFRLTAAKGHPIRRGASGSATLHSVKDRYGSVERHGVLESGREQWWYLGSLVVDDSGLNVGSTSIRLAAPSRDQAGVSVVDPLDALGEAIIESLDKRDRRYETQNQLGVWLRADGVTYNDRDLGPALERLEQGARIAREPYRGTRARAGWCVDLENVDEE